MKNNSKHLVLARYNEDASWAKDMIPYFDKVFIYNKGEDEILIDNCNIIKLKNVGREAQTYLQYIIDNYNNIPDYVLFSQARPEDRGWGNDINKFIQDIKRVSACNESLMLLGWVNVEILEIQEPIEEHKFQKMMYKDEFEALFNVKYPKGLPYSSGATLWVSGENIKIRSLKFYTDLNERLNKDIHPPMAWIVERFWPAIFSRGIESFT